MRSRRLFLLLVIVMATVMGAGSARAGLDLPADATALVPGSAVMVAAVRSLDAAEPMWAQLDGAERGPDGPEDDQPSLREMIAKFAPDVAPYLRGDQPVVLAMDLDLAGGQTPYQATLVVPVKPEALNPPFLRNLSGGLVARTQGGYLGLSMRGDYAQAAAGSNLLASLPTGVIAASMDLETVLTTVQPFIEMGLSAMEQAAQAKADSTGGPDTAAQMQATQSLIRGLLTSLTRLDLAIDDQGALPRFTLNVAGKPGSLLDLGPQPNLQDAVALGRYLPADLPLAEIGALDLGEALKRWQPLTASFLELAAASMPAELHDRYVDWLQQSLQMQDLWSHPFAMAFDLSSDGIRLAMVQSIPDAPAQLDRILTFYQSMNDAGFGLSLQEQPARDLAGVRVRSFKIVLDQKQLAALAGTSGDDEKMADAMQAICRMYPTIWVAALPDNLVACADPDPGVMGDLLQAVQRKQGTLRRDLADAVDRAAPGSQVLLVGDLRRLMRSAFAWAAAIDTEKAQEMPEIPAGPPVPVVFADTIVPAQVGMTCDVDLVALHDLFKSLEEWQKAQKSKGSE